MMKKMAIIACVLVLAGSNVFATPVNSVTMEHKGFGASDKIKIWGGGHKDKSITSGVFMFDKTAGTGTGELIDDGLLGGFCVDLRQRVAKGSNVYEVIMPQEGPRPVSLYGMGEAKAGYLSELWGRYYDESWAAGGKYSKDQKNKAEAFGAAVWEIVYEDVPGVVGGWDVRTDGTRGSGGFRATGLDYQLANSWLASLDGTGAMANLRVLSHDSGQDFLVVVPEPATVALFAIGGVFMLRKKKTDRVVV